MILFYSISGPLSCLVHLTKYLGETCSGCPLTSAFILAHCTQSLWTLLQGSILPSESRCKRRHFSAFISLKFLSIGHSVKPLLPGNFPAGSWHNSSSSPGHTSPIASLLLPSLPSSAFPSVSPLLPGSHLQPCPECSHSRSPHLVRFLL